MFIVPLPRHSACMEYMPTLTLQITPIYAYMARMERLGYDCRIVDLPNLKYFKIDCVAVAEFTSSFIPAE